MTATGTDDDGNAVNGFDDATVTITDVPSSITVTKTADPTGVSEPGGDVTFTVRIDNTSAVDSVTITSLVDNVHGDLDGQGNCSMPQTIAAGGFYTCTFTGTVTGNAGEVETNTVTATGTDDDGVPVSGFDSAAVSIEALIIDIIVEGKGGSIGPSKAVVGTTDVDVATGTEATNYGTRPVFVITPDDCRQIVGVWIDVGGSGGSGFDTVVWEEVTDQVAADGTYIFPAVTSDRNMKVEFEIIQYTVTVIVEGNGSVDPPGPEIVNCGTDNLFTMTPGDDRHYVANVELDGTSVMEDVVIDGETRVGEYNLLNIRNDHTLKVTFQRDLIFLISASYEVCETLLTLEFDNPIDPARTRFNRIDMEIGDSGKLDFGLGDLEGCLEAIPGTPYPDPVTGEMRYPMEIDILCEVPAVANLAIAAFMTNKCDDVDLILAAGAFTDQDGVPNAAADIPLQITCEGIKPMQKGDLNDDSRITAYDAGLLLQFSIFGSPALPVHDKIVNVSNWMESFGYPGAEAELTHFLTETDGQAGVTANDAVAILQFSAGLIAALPDSKPCVPGVDGLVANAPDVDVTRRNGRLVANSYDSQKLEVAIDLDDVRGVHSADIVLTYNPQMMEVADVSGTSDITGWLSTYGTPTPGRLKIALAGLSQPTGDGSLVTVSFDAVSVDAIKHLELTELKLNGLKATVQNLPEAFALLQNYPNPFNPETWIPYHLSEPADVTITIYGMTGQIVRQLELGNRMPGSYIDKSKAGYWDGRNERGEKVSSGIYFYQLQSGRNASVRKMIIAK